jgi:hypothetical protein
VLHLFLSLSDQIVAQYIVFDNQLTRRTILVALERLSASCSFSESIVLVTILFYYVVDGFFGSISAEHIRFVVLIDSGSKRLDVTPLFFVLHQNVSLVFVFQELLQIAFDLGVFSLVHHRRVGHVQLVGALFRQRYVVVHALLQCLLDAMLHLLEISCR